MIRMYCFYCASIVLVAYFLSSGPLPTSAQPGPGNLQANQPAVATFDAVFTEIIIRDTRSKHNDTDFATLAVSVDGKSQMSPKVSLGDHNNGQFPVGARVSFEVPPGAHEVKFAISVVNAGHTNSAQLDQMMDLVSTQIGKSATGEQPQQALLAMLIKAFGGLMNPNCDGPVVTAVTSGNPSDLKILRALHKGQSRRILAGTDYGSDSAAGCGHNSNYGYGVDVTRTN